MEISENNPVDPNDYISETARVAYVGKRMISFGTRVCVAAEILMTGVDIFLLEDVHDNVIRAGGIAVAGVAAYKVMDAIEQRTENIALQKDMDNRGDL